MESVRDITLNLNFAKNKKYVLGLPKLQTFYKVLKK